VIETLPQLDLGLKKELVKRIIGSRHINRSARLRDLFVYLSDRVLEEGAEDIHEIEVGHKVFGRPSQYDTSADNIVRVHASMLRKRLAEYFEAEGEHEALLIEIPRGNYAPLFRERPITRPEPREIALSETEVLSPSSALPLMPASAHEVGWLSPRPHSRAVWAFATLAAIFFGLTLYFFLSSRAAKVSTQYPSIAEQPTLKQFWSGIFPASQPAEVVLDDASLDFYQEATGHSVALAEYFDRSYLTSVDKSAEAARVDPQLIRSIMIRRQSFFADSSLIWKLAQIAGTMHSAAIPQFARDFSFRQMKAGNVILLGNRQSNPWIQPFEPNLSIHWVFDPALHSYYPRDMTGSESSRDRYRTASTAGIVHEGYATVSFLPNLNGTGNVLILSATGGSAMGAALNFLSDENSMRQLRQKLPQDRAGNYPYFDVLLQTEKGANTGRSVSILIIRPPVPIKAGSDSSSSS
jgi:hypothetical protein